VTGEGNDSLVDVDGVLGTTGSDTLLGDARNNFFDAGPGDDYVVGGGGDDELFGGPGTDMASWATVTTAVVVDLSFEYASGEGFDRVAGVENVTGGRGNDTLRGDAGPNFIDGYLGTDTCTGNGGADTFLRCP
jgi:Ca2+-binding RTX toxin-like protein